MAERQLRPLRPQSDDALAGHGKRLRSARVVTDPSGDTEMKIEVDESSLPDSSVLVQASYSGRTATRKFQLRKVEA